VKISLVHNYYQQPGGEDAVFAGEGALLEAHGHEVVRYTAHNDEVAGLGRLELARKTLWNSESYRKLRELFREAQPQVVHVHNTLPLVSPAVYYAAKAEGVAVVQTLHNFRLSCINGLFFRDGHVCEDCLGHFAPLPGVLHACYRGSRSASGVVAGMLAYHKLRRTYHEMVDVYIALTEFSKQKFIEAGLPPDKIVVKPNFIDPDPGVGTDDGGFTLFAGRLSPEKGMHTLISTWRIIGKRLQLKVVGDGPMAAEVERASEHIEGVNWLGRLPHDEVLALMQRASFLVFPSECYEGFPMTLVEAFAIGLPVVASRLGSMASLIDHGRTGLLFTPGNATELADAVNWLLAHPDEAAAMRQAARAEYEAKYTAESNYQRLMAIYERAIEANGAR